MTLPFEKIKRELLVKRKAETSPKYGIEPGKRPTDELINYGVVNIDKPRGPTPFTWEIPSGVSLCSANP